MTQMKNVKCSEIGTANSRAAEVNSLNTDKLPGHFLINELPGYEVNMLQAKFYGARRVQHIHYILWRHHIELGEPLAVSTAKKNWLPWLQTNWGDSGYKSFMLVNIKNAWKQKSIHWKSHIPTSFSHYSNLSPNHAYLTTDNLNISEGVTTTTVQNQYAAYGNSHRCSEVTLQKETNKKKTNRVVTLIALHLFGCNHCTLVLTVYIVSIA